MLKSRGTPCGKDADADDSDESHESDVSDESDESLISDVSSESEDDDEKRGLPRSRLPEIRLHEGFDSTERLFDGIPTLVANGTKRAPERGHRKDGPCGGLLHDERDSIGSDPESNSTAV